MHAVKCLPPRRPPPEPAGATPEGSACSRAGARRGGTSRRGSPPPPAVETFHLPAVSEPSLAWATAGGVDFREREGGGPRVTNRIKKGAFFLTTGGAAYDVRWRAVSAGPFAAMPVFVEQRYGFEIKLDE